MSKDVPLEKKIDVSWGLLKKPFPSVQRSIITRTITGTKFENKIVFKKSENWGKISFYKVWDSVVFAMFG